MALITINEQIAAIVTLLGNVPGDLTHLDEHPRALQSRTLPCTVTTPGPAEYERGERGAGHLRVTRQLRIKVFIMPVEEGYEYQAERALKPYLTAIPDELAKHPLVRLDDGRTFELTLDGGSDSGLSLLQYGNKQYAGTLITVNTITEDRVPPVR